MGTNDADFADEVNLYANWYVNEHLTLSSLYGVALPGAGARQAFGRGDSYHLFEIFAFLTF